ncbi:MAG: nucleotidyltransferase family protein [Williamsia sp.]|nr:nucleotidyltransferase family protein [Williamsia sp.]
MIREAIILAGGLGTRLRSVVPELPACMAPVLAKPFIGYVVDHLYKQGVLRFIFSLGYKSALLEQYLNTQYSNLDIVFSSEEEPLGTGGAVKLACPLLRDGDVFVVNGDSFFKIDLQKLGQFHQSRQADCTLSLRKLRNFDRYGAVQLGEDNRIQAFQERGFYREGLINGGVYALQAENFGSLPLPHKFSFETDYLKQEAGKQAIYGLVQDGYFIDIGIPEEYELAQTELILHL